MKVHVTLATTLALLISQVVYAENFEYIGKCIGANDYAGSHYGVKPVVSAVSPGTQDVYVKYGQRSKSILDKMRTCGEAEHATGKIPDKCLMKLSKNDKAIFDAWFVGVNMTKHDDIGSLDAIVKSVNEACAPAYMLMQR